MKLFLLGLTAIVTNSAFADFSGEFVKNNAGVDLKQQGNSIEFSINSTVGQNACNLSGMAVMMDAKRAVYSSDDNSDKCVAVFNFSDGGLKVTTKSCDSHCGLNANGSMDGTYKTKQSAPAENTEMVVTTRIIDRIEYEGISNSFCAEVASHVHTARKRKVDLYAITDAITGGIDKNVNLDVLRKTAAKRVVTVLAARIYADKKMSLPEAREFSEVECGWINQTIQGITALNQR